MNGAWWKALWWPAGVLLLTPVSFAAGCAATPDAAVLQAVGGNSTSDSQGVGYRVRDIVVDPLLHRAFVHVEQCDHPERPLVLLPFAAAREMRTTDLQPALALARPGDRAEALVRSGSVVAVVLGDDRMHMTVQGHLLTSAAVGSEVDVQLASLSEGPQQPGELLKLVHGRLTAADRVEVQP